MQITDAITAAELDTVRLLLREYVGQLGVSLDFQGFEVELATLPGAYVPPRGRLLLATRDGVAVGCVAMRATSDGRAEMKRLFVRDAARGAGVGQALMTAIIGAAREAGYREMVLDTLATMASAQRMYEAAGFRDIPAYTSNSLSGMRFMGLSLQDNDAWLAARQRLARVGHSTP